MKLFWWKPQSGYRRKKVGVKWWTPAVLTNHNPDKSNIGLNIDEAYEVFLELRRRRLLKHIFAPVGDGKSVSAFEIIEGKEGEWNSLMNKKSIWELYVWPGLKWLFEKIWLLLLFIGGILLTNFLDRYSASVLDDPEEVPRYSVQIEEGQFEKLLRQQRTEGLSLPPILKIQVVDENGAEKDQITTQSEQ